MAVVHDVVGPIVMAANPTSVTIDAMVAGDRTGRDGVSSACSLSVGCSSGVSPVSSRSPRPLPVIGFPGYGCHDDDVGERTSV